MSRNCVLPFNEITIEALRTDIDLALRTWTAQAGESSPIHYLRLVHQLRRQGYSAQAATYTLLAEAIVLLGGPSDPTPGKRGKTAQDREDAELLVEHYRDGFALEKMCAAHSMSMSGLTKRLKSARKRLAEVVYQLEINARVAHRLAQLQRLEASLNQTLVGAQPAHQKLTTLLRTMGPPYLIAVKGIGGIGKSTHVDRVLREMINDDGWDQVVWISAQQERLTIGGRLRQSSQPVLTQEALLERLFEQFFPQQPASAALTHEEMLARLAARLKECPCCICIDNAETAADIDMLLPLLERFINPSKVIFTTRVAIGGYTVPPATVELAELDEAGAAMLLSEIARNNHLTRVQALSELDLRRIYATIGGNPLVIGIIAGQIETIGLNPTLDYLRTAGSRVNDELFAYIYAQSWRLLNQAERSVLLALLLLAPQGGEYALLSFITDLGKGDLLQALNHLLALSLVQTRSNGNETYFWLHTLTRTFLQDQVLGAMSSTQHTPLAPAPPVHLPDFDQYIRRAVQFLINETERGGPILSENERSQALHIAPFALDLSLRDAGAWAATCALFLQLGPKFDLGGFCAGWLPYLQHAVTVSQSIGDAQREALLQSQLALHLQKLGDYEAAHRALQASIRTSSGSGDNARLADALIQRAHIFCLQRRHQAARPLMQQAHDLLSESDPQREYLYYLEGLIALNEHDPVSAEQWFRQSLQICQAQDNQRLIAKQLGVVGTAMFRQGQLDQAQGYYEESISFSTIARDTGQKAKMEMGIGVIWILRNEPGKAIEQFAKAEPTMVQEQDLLSMAMLDTNWGIAKRQLKEWPEAQARLAASVERWRSLGDFYHEANSHYERALIFREQALSDNARHALFDALACLAKCEPGSGTLPLQDKITACLASLPAVDKRFA